MWCTCWHYKKPTVHPKTVDLNRTILHWVHLLLPLLQPLLWLPANEQIEYKIAFATFKAWLTGVTLYLRLMRKQVASRAHL
jgi:hypothetical protein